MSEKSEKAETKPAAPAIPPATLADIGNITLQNLTLNDIVALICLAAGEVQLIPHRGGAAVARRRYSMAQGYVDAVQKIRSGEIVLPVDKPTTPVMVSVTMTDPDTGETIVKEMPEADFYLPNQPPLHPDNQRSNAREEYADAVQ